MRSSPISPAMPPRALPEWAVADGAPAPHLIRSALRTAALLDASGSPLPRARHSYSHDPSGGLFPVEDLRRGEQLLIDCGLVREQDGVLYPLLELSDLVHVERDVAEEVLLLNAIRVADPAWLGGIGTGPLSLPIRAHEAVVELIPDPERREAFLLSLGAGREDEGREALGLLGEESVVDRAREQLAEFGHPELASSVRRVSAYSDRLGYDVTAPMIEGGTRRFEVKTTRGQSTETTLFFISRNEATVGLRDANWALVVCRVTEESVAIVGWCRGAALAPYLPIDSAGGRWREAEVTFPTYLLFPDIPPAM